MSYQCPTNVLPMSYQCPTNVLPMPYQCPTKKVIPCAVLCYMVKYANVLSRKEIETFLATLISIKVKKFKHVLQS